jgi:hypothetical protein
MVCGHGSSEDRPVELGIDGSKCGPAANVRCDKELGSTSKRWRSVVSRLGLFGNLATETALLNVMSNGDDYGNDWIAWFRHEGSSVNNESLIRHQHTPSPTFHNRLLPE